MSIGNAKKFIIRGMEDQELRNKLNRAPTIEALQAVLEEAGLTFSTYEFEDAYNNSRTECQFEEQADKLSEFRMWWELLNTFFGVQPAPFSCASSSSCSRGSCKGCDS